MFGVEIGGQPIAADHPLGEVEGLGQLLPELLLSGASVFGRLGLLELENVGRELTLEGLRRGDSLAKSVESLFRTTVVAFLFPRDRTEDCG